jgi:hypothetical protein
MLSRWPAAPSSRCTPRASRVTASTSHAQVITRPAVVRNDDDRTLSANGSLPNGPAGPGEP